MTTTLPDPQPRPLSEIAADIRANWANINYGAEPYVAAMQELNSINDRFVTESARDQVIRFLINAKTWRGPKAREIKAELKAMLGVK